MQDAQIIWDDEPDQNIDHIGEHGLTPDEVEDVLLDDRIPIDTSHATGRPCKFGWTHTGKHILVVWDVVSDDPLIIYPVTAYEVLPRN